jgi:spermidine synthase
VSSGDFDSGTHTGADEPVSVRFEEIDRHPTPIGEISLRRRLEPSLKVDVYEVKLGDEFLMSSLFTVSEIALAELALGQLDGSDLDVLVGGLGLGYTARAVLDDPRVRSMHVVEVLAEVIEWHQRGLLPLANVLTSDDRCTLLNGDFFAMLASLLGFGSSAPTRFHAIVVDIDHSPRHTLHPSHDPFYKAHGLRSIADLLYPGGIFALWSDASPDADFIATAGEVFASCDARVVTFPNFYTGGESASTVYLATSR